MNPELTLYIERLTKLLNLLEVNNLQPTLLCGTLLSFIREGKPFEHDYKDIDIALKQEDYWKVRQILDNQSDFTYYRIWRNELAVYYKERKIDIFFLETDNFDNLYIYSYKRNTFTGKYDTEWRTIFSTKDFYPLKSVPYSLLNRNVYIPNNYEKVLTTHYGDWRTPNSKWTINEMTNIDKEYREIAFIIPSFLRPEKTQKCIESIYATFPRDWYRIYLGNQDNLIRPSYLHLDDKFYNLEYNSGLAKTRQYLINQSSEPFIIIMDDDFIFTKESNLNIFIQILLDKENNGVVGGQLRNYNRKAIFSYLYNLEYDINTLKKIEINPSFIKTKQSLTQQFQEYAYGDLILNFSMAKRSMFNDIKYDEKFKLIEHTDFYLRNKLLNKWKVSFTPNVYAEHQIENNSDAYNKYRHWQEGENVKIGYQHFKEKWNIDLQNIQVINLEK